MPNAPPPTEVTGPPLAAVHAHNGLSIDDDTCRPAWDGDTLDYYARDILVTHHLRLDNDAATRDAPDQMAGPAPWSLDTG